MFWSFFHDHLQGGPPLCFVPLLFLPLICVRVITQYVAACVCHLCVFGVLVCWWSDCEQFTSRSPTRTPNTHTWHTHVATYCVIIRTQRTQISGRNSNGTKHSGGTPWRWSWKKTETCRGFILTDTFLTFYWF